MAKTAALVPHLPYLRRYARALTGSQERGDRYVKLAVEAMLSEQDRLDPEIEPRLQLFAGFHAVWSMVDSLAPEPAMAEPKLGDDLRHSIDQLQPMSRQVLLLMSLEGFDAEAVSYILKLDESDVLRLFAEAREEVSGMAAADVMIIEDDPIIAMDLSNIVREMGHKVSGSATHEDEAVAMAERSRPDLILADINLAEGGDGVHAVSRILRQLHVPVIFVTAVPERLLTGEVLEPAFVLAKPYAPDVVKTTIAQALSFNGPTR